MKLSIVLALDDCREINEYLTRRGDFDVLATTDSGAEALRLIEELAPDIAICDLVLKDIDGLTLLEKVARSKVKTKILVYSAFDSDEIIRCACERGASLYLVKPLTAQILADRALSVATYTEKPSEPARQVQSDGAAELRISNVFLSAGIPPHIKGYGFLRTGVRLAMKDPAILGNITKQLYPKIASEFNTSPSKVERAIRHAIEVAWNRGRIENLNSIFGVSFYLSGDKPTNGEFIALVADRLIQEQHMGKLN